MEIRERIEEHIVILSLTGTLHSESDAMMLRERMYACVERKETRVIFDLSGLTYMNSWGLGLLVAILSMMRRAGGDLRLASLAEHVHNLFIVTQLTKVFTTYDNVAEAVKSYTQR